MEIGDLGLPLDPAVSPAEEALKLTPDFATTQHQQMVGPLALVLLLKVFHATRKRAILVHKLTDKHKILLT
jgi:hypothetical protein